MKSATDETGRGMSRAQAREVVVVDPSGAPPREILRIRWSDQPDDWVATSCILDSRGEGRLRRCPSPGTRVRACIDSYDDLPFTIPSVGAPPALTLVPRIAR